MFTLICILLAMVAVLYLVFFVIFKLIWVLCKKKRNFWPLVLSGILTGLIMLVVGYYSYKLYKNVFKPLTPISQAISLHKQPLFGSRNYTSPDKDFTLSLQNGLFMSNYFNIEPVKFLVGVDINSFLKNNQKNQNPFAFMVVAKVPDTKSQSAQEVLQVVRDTAVKMSNERPQGDFILEPIGDIETLDVGPNATAAFSRNNLYTRRNNIATPTAVMCVKTPQYIYWLVGCALPDAQAIEQTIQSFHLLP